MSAVPLLSAAQMRAIAPLLPESRRDRVMISAICYRQNAGAGLRDVCDLYEVSRTRLADWTLALEADGTLGRIMDGLGLERAPSRVWRAGGRAWWKGRGHAGRVSALKLGKFRQRLSVSR